jgi:hypothetical protein
MAADVQRLNGSNSIGLLCYIWADVFQMPPQRQAVKRCDEIPSGFRHIARGLCDVRSPAGLRTSAGFAKGKTLRKARGRWVLYFVLTKIRIKDKLILSAKAEQNKKQTHNKKIDKKAKYCAPY